MDKTNHEMVVAGIILDEGQIYNLQEIVDRFQIDENFLKEMFEYGLYEKLDLTGLRRIQTALRLHQDLEVNLAGAALVLELLEQLENLRSQLSIMEKHFR